MQRVLITGYQKKMKYMSLRIIGNSPLIVQKPVHCNRLTKRKLNSK
jgi:hypothetical protein